MSRIARSAGVFFLLVAVLGVGRPVPTLAQDRWLGGVAGVTCARQVWQPAVDTECRTGLLIGVMAVVETPAPWVAVHVEGTYTQRGTHITEDLGTGTDGEVRTRMLSLPVLARIGPRLDRVRPYFEVGISLEQVLGTDADPATSQILRDESQNLFNAVGGIGLSVRVRPAARLELGARWTEGLNDAYLGDFLSIRNRTAEFVIGLVRRF